MSLITEASEPDYLGCPVQARLGGIQQCASWRTEDAGAPGSRHSLGANLGSVRLEIVNPAAKFLIPKLLFCQ